MAINWDIFVMDLPSDAETIEAIPGDFVSQPPSPRSDLIAAMRTVVPFADFTDPAWGQIVTPEFVIEVNLGRDELVDSFALHVRGGAAVVACVAAILDALGLRAVDASSEDFFKRDAALDSFRRWRNYQDRVMGSESGSRVPEPDIRRLCSLYITSLPEQSPRML